MDQLGAFWSYLVEGGWNVLFVSLIIGFAVGVLITLGIIARQKMRAKFDLWLMVYLFSLVISLVYYIVNPQDVSIIGIISTLTVAFLTFRMINELRDLNEKLDRGILVQTARDRAEDLRREQDEILRKAKEMISETNS